MSITHGSSARTDTWVAPVVATVVTLPMALLALFFGGFAPMACDSCNGAEAESFTRGFNTGFTYLQAGLVIAVVLLLVSWCLPQTEANVFRRRVFAALAPGTVVFSVFLFATLAPWPN
ncbi:hypothetical protein ACQ86D_19930 [Streptomyces galilaeus]